MVTQNTDSQFAHSWLILLSIFVLLSLPNFPLRAQSRKLTPDNIDRAIETSAAAVRSDSLRPVFHLTPPAGCMGDPNGGIFYDGWYHIFYGLNPFSAQPGGWYWAHARSDDLLHWQHMDTGLTPAFEHGLTGIGSGSTIISSEGKKLAFYSYSDSGALKFWRAEFLNDKMTQWSHSGKNPVLTLDYPGLPAFDGFWRDPFVFAANDRTFLIACADLFDADYVAVPIFEAQNEELTDWEYKGILFTYPKHKSRNFEVPELRQVGNRWIFLASSDAPVDRCLYFVGDFDTDDLKFTPVSEGVVDYSGHYYAQETIQDDNGDLILMAWMPGWDRDWLPLYMNDPLKNDSKIWNGCFALPRKLSLDQNDRLIQKPVEALTRLRGQETVVPPRELPVDGPMTAYHMVDEIRGNQLEIILKLDLNTASFCGINLLCNKDGVGGMFVVWSGDEINVDGVRVPLDEWQRGDELEMQIFVDGQLAEIFINQGRYTVSRKIRSDQIKGDHVAATSLGGTAKLISLKAWKLTPLVNAGEPAR